MNIISKGFQDYKLLIFDADGTLRRSNNPSFVVPHCIDEQRIIPFVKNWFNNNTLHNQKIGIASNQGGIPLGFVKKKEVLAVLKDLAQKLFPFEIPKQAIQICDKHPREKHYCRKPRPGMLETIMNLYNILPKDTLFIGNSPIDQKAAENAGCDFKWAHDFFDYEKSAGAVIYKIKNNKRMYLLIQHKNGLHWGFPKGHFEENESEFETANREVLEETGIEANINKYIQIPEWYTMPNGIGKEVIYFLGEKKNSQKLIKQDDEVESIGWFPFDEAAEKITYDGAKRVLKKFDSFLLK